ncbi:hypothetical protein MMC06_002188 [Schaereria dolodes]|nr:hypothetical protein [Schaereria dolodes]
MLIMEAVPSVTQKIAGVTTKSGVTLQNDQEDLATTNLAEDRSVQILLLTDATKQSNWSGKLKEDDMSAKPMRQDKCKNRYDYDTSRDEK